LARPRAVERGVAEDRLEAGAGEERRMPTTSIVDEDDALPAPWPKLMARRARKRTMIASMPMKVWASRAGSSRTGS
jgi:hypothetical protein